MHHSFSHAKLLAAALALALSACTFYKPAPIDPAQSQQEFLHRSLDNPDLLKFVHAGHTTENGATLAVTPATAPATSPATAPSESWNLENLTRAAIYYHPDLRAAIARLRSAEASKITAGESPNPSVSFAPEYATHAGDVPSPWTVGLTFDIPIETAGKREHRIAAAKAAIESARYDLADTTWKVRARLRDALANYLLDKQTIAALEREVAARQRQVDALTARLKAGESSRADLDLSRVDLLTSRQLLRAKQGEMADDLTKLAAAVGLPPTAIDNANLDWPDIDAFSPYTAAEVDQLQSEGLINRLDLRKSLADYAQAEANLQLEIAKQYPDLHLGPGYTFDQGQNKWQLGATLDLPIFNQNAGAIAEAKAHRDELAANFQSLQAQIIADTFSAQARYNSALLELQDASAQLTTTAHEVQAARRGLELGSEDRLSVSGLEVQEAVADRLRLDAVRKAQLAKGALEDAVERPLPSGPAASTEPATQPSTQENIQP